MPMLADPSRKYRPAISFSLPDRRWPDGAIERPLWCSVDLRDGNQALAEPMDIERKLALFQLLLQIGFRQIEVGFPAASQLDFDFVRKLVEDELVPDDVTIQVLTQARQDLVERSFLALRGARRAIVHFYNATAPVMRKTVFNTGRDGVRDIAVRHAALLCEMAARQPETAWQWQYSPEMFSATEPDFALEVCNAVIGVFQPTAQAPLILNLPSTVECMPPTVFADQVEWMHRHIDRREAVILSVHPHNDRGTGTAAAEMALMAGAQRLEGCLFGNGERTGNLDLVTVALNLYTQGIHPGLDFSDIDAIRETVERCNRLPVHHRHPYVGEYVYTSFSGSHQDAIRKAFASRKDGERWEIPYLPLDPKDLGRSYEAVIRVNAQSGKGGIAWLLETDYGLHLPRSLQQEFSRTVQKLADATAAELRSDQLWALFEAEYLRSPATLAYDGHAFLQDAGPEPVGLLLRLVSNGRALECRGWGNGPIDAAVSALAHATGCPLRLLDYSEHAMSHGANARAACYVQLQAGQAEPVHGAAIDGDIIAASLKAILSALGRHVHGSGVVGWRGHACSSRQQEPAIADSQPFQQ